MIEQVHETKSKMGRIKITIHADNSRQINQNINTAPIRTKTNCLVVISLLLTCFTLK